MLVQFLDYFPGIIMILIFLVMMLLMYLRKISALLALPLMALLFSLVGIVDYGRLFSLMVTEIGWHAFRVFCLTGGIGVALICALIGLAVRKLIKPGIVVLGCVVVAAGTLLLNYEAIARLLRLAVIDQLFAALQAHEIVDTVIHDGALKLHDAYTVAIFGGMLAILVREKKIAETFIKYAAELAGDNPFVVAAVMMFVTFMLFTTLGGLGAIIMVGTIILPIMLSLGIPALVAAGIFLVGICAGGTFNPGNWALYESSLGIAREKVQTFALFIIVLYLMTGLAFIGMNLVTRKRRRYWSVAPGIPHEEAPRRVPLISLLSPVIPIILVFKLTNFSNLFSYIKGYVPLLDRVIEIFTRFAIFWDSNIGAWDFIPAFIAGLAFCLITTWEKDNIKILTKSVIEGAESVMPAVLLMFGIGMLLQAVRHPDVSVHLTPIVKRVIPSTPLAYIIGFGVCAPLALYRGPLNIWGLGLGIAALFLESGRLSAPLIMGVFMSVGAIQGVCDPTNTHNVWIASYLSEDVIRIMKKMLPSIWVLAVAGLLVSSMLFSKGFTYRSSASQDVAASQALLSSSSPGTCAPVGHLVIQPSM
jgi:DcuC family C4-dicarboxylate transporter